MEAELRTVETLYGLGHWLLEQQRPADALHVFRTMLVSAPDDERSWLGLGQCHELNGADEIARDLYLLAERTLTRSFRCPLARARLLRRLDVLDSADDAFALAEDRAAALDDDAAAAIAAERQAS